MGNKRGRAGARLVLVMLTLGAAGVFAATRDSAVGRQENLPAADLLPTPAPPPPSAPAPAPAGDAQAVRSVTDGDTIVLADGRRVRLAQVDAPEATSRRECYGDESTKALVALVGDKSVTLRRPSNGPARDRYGRTLAEISVDGASVNEALVRMGAAEWYEAFASEDADLAGRLQAAEMEAREANRGLWSACAASASSSSKTTSFLPSTSPPSTASPLSGGACHPAYPDDCIPGAPPDLDCVDIGRSVRVDHRYGDPHRFDGNDDDGRGCERS